MADRRCILIVDDDQELRELLAVALSADGWTTAAVGNGRDALNHLRSTADTDVILLNLTMPVMDGAEFRAAQLRDRSLAWIPTVVMSGAIDAERTARRLGAARFIPKPADLDRVRAALREIETAVAHVPQRRRG
jgi:CheY-like chemotaxis protein